jgi:hypothetical protein
VQTASSRISGRIIPVTQQTHFAGEPLRMPQLGFFDFGFWIFDFGEAKPGRSSRAARVAGALDTEERNGDAPGFRPRGRGRYSLARGEPVEPVLSPPTRSGAGQSPLTTHRSSDGAGTRAGVEGVFYSPLTTYYSPISHDPCLPS